MRFLSLMFIFFISSVSFADDFTISGRYGVLSQFKYDSKSYESIDNSFHINGRYQIIHHKSIRFGSFLDYASETLLPVYLASTSIRTSLLSYGLFATLHHAQSGLYITASVGLNRPLIDDSYLISLHENGLKNANSTNIDVSSSIVGGRSYLVFMGYEIDSSLSIEGSYKYSTFSYSVTANYITNGNDASRDIASETFNLSVFTLGPAYSF